MRNTNFMKEFMNGLASGLTLIGAAAGSLIVASNNGLQYMGYMLFLTSSVASLYLLKNTQGAPKALVLQNWFFVCVNIYGLVRYF